MWMFDPFISQVTEQIMRELVQKLTRANNNYTQVQKICFNRKIHITSDIWMFDPFISRVVKQIIREPVQKLTR